MKKLKDKKMSYISLLKWMVNNMNEDMKLSAIITGCTFYPTKSFSPKVIFLSEGDRHKLIGVELKSCIIDTSDFQMSDEQGNIGHLYL